MTMKKPGIALHPTRAQLSHVIGILNPTGRYQRYAIIRYLSGISMNATELLKKLNSVEHIADLHEKILYLNANAPILDSVMCHYMYYQSIYKEPIYEAQCGAHECASCVFQEYHPHRELLNVITQIEKANKS